MKCLLVLTIALVAFVASNEQPKAPDIPVDVNRCLAQTGITPEQLLKHNRGQRSDEKEVHEYDLCILKQSDFFTEENGFDVDRMVARFKSAHLDEEKARELSTKCVDRNEQGTTPAEWAYRVMQCLSDNKIEELLSDARQKFRESNNN